MNKSARNYQSYRSSPIRNLQTSQAAKQRFEDQFFQIRCTRLQKQKQQLEDEVIILNTKVLEGVSNIEQVILLKTKIAHLTEDNQNLRLKIEQLISTPSSAQQKVRQLFDSRQRIESDHMKQVDDLLRLYQTAKAETAIFRAQNQRLRNAELRQSRQSKQSDIDGVSRNLEISKLKLSISDFQADKSKLKSQLDLKQKQIQRLNKLYNYEKRTNEQKQRQHLLLINQVKQSARSQPQNKYYSAQQTPVKTIVKQTELSKAQQQILSLRKKIQTHNEVHQSLLQKYSSLINQYEEVVKQRNELRQSGQYTLREAVKQNIVERPRQQKTQLVSNNQLNRLKRVINEKDQQIKNILTRFAPLLKIQEGSISLEEDRKQRMQKHWKADIAILDVLLSKYKIQVFQQ